MTIILSAFWLILSTAALACTGVTLKTPDGGTVFGRTLEFGFPMQSDIVALPRGFAYQGTGTKKVEGKAWKGKYGVVGASGMGLDIVVDGLNEQGLHGGIFYFPDFAQYTDLAQAVPGKAMAPWEFVTWALSSFSSVEELRAQLGEVQVIGVSQAQLRQVPPLHYIFTDAKGKTLVVEPTGGKLVAFDNPYGVFTNSPSFDWHVTNLRNYANLRPQNAASLKIAGQTVAPLGQGSGLLGLPGDFTPPSRFVRALAYSAAASPGKTAADAVWATNHILNNFDIPLGSVRGEEKSFPEYTQWSSISDLKNKRFFFKTAANQQLRTVDLKKVDFNAKAAIHRPMESPAVVEEVKF